MSTDVKQLIKVMDDEVDLGDIMMEKIEYVLDVIQNIVIEVMWMRVHAKQGWILWAEEYGPASEEHYGFGFSRKTVILEDAIAADALYTGLVERMSIK